MNTMLPPGHLAGGYVLYTIFTRVVYRAPPVGSAVIALAVGTQLPDMIDKPLAYWTGVVPGRSLAHSMLVAAPGTLVAIGIGLRLERVREAVAFSIGWWSHLGLDAYPYFLSGNLHRASFLLWPLGSGFDGTARSFRFHLEHHVPSLGEFREAPIETLLDTGFGTELLLAAGVVLVWLYDGAPGPKTAWRGLKRLRTGLGGNSGRD